MNLFAYGTLMWPDILEDVVGRNVDGCPAVLENVRRLRVKNEVYPSLVSCEGGEVSGVLYCGLSEQDIAALDRFEGPEYDRRNVQVEIGGAPMEAETYFTSEKGLDLLEETEWIPEQLPGELRRCFRESYKGWS